MGRDGPGPADRRDRRRLLGGTYIRALARDLGDALGTAAYLGALTRTASGPFTLDSPMPLDEIRGRNADGPPGLLPFLRPLDTGLERFPVVTLTADEVAAVARGQFIRPGGGLRGPAEHYRLQRAAGTLVAIASPSGGNRLAPDKVFIAPAPALASTAPVA